MPQINLASPSVIGAVLAIVVLVLALVFWVTGGLTATVAGLFILLALARLL